MTKSRFKTGKPILGLCWDYPYCNCEGHYVYEENKYKGRIKSTKDMCVCEHYKSNHAKADDIHPCLMENCDCKKYKEQS